MNRSLYTRFKSAYLVLDGIGFVPAKKKFRILSDNFYLKVKVLQVTVFMT